jgi:predicted dehydrogenase/threonine dehydrogenase-like Zn-dependent dehydrogenase
MKQILQNLRNGQTTVEEVPAPGLIRTGLLIQTRASLISAGTERMLVEFGKASLLSKARSQPEKVRQVLDKIRTDGLLPTLEAVFNRLDEPLPLGYCNAGVVLQVGEAVGVFQPGDRVVSNGPHAEIVAVPHTLCAKMPEGVSDDQGAFVVLSSIALQGIRLLQPTLGERVVVYGLGLIGLVAVQLLRAHGCEVLGVDINPGRLALAQKYGAAVAGAAQGGDPVAAAGAWTEGKGADGVLITASAKTDEIVHQSAQMCRKRGRIVLVGVVELNLRRADFYDKELTFQVSCSYGPGRYDEGYEQGGRDYPYGFVRWTEQRNFQAVLDMMRTGRLVVDDLITNRFPLGAAAEAYAKVAGDSGALGVILDYPSQVAPTGKVQISQVSSAPTGRPVVGVIGAGNFSKMTLMPALSKCRASIAYVADLNGAAAQHLGRKYGAAGAVTDYREVLKDPSVHAAIIAVGHSLHARFVCEALEAGKHVFVEKPLAMNTDELAQVVAAAAKAPDRQVMVGFNRRFSPHTVRMKEALAGRSEPLAMAMTVNAGAVPPEHWVHDPVRGGGRIVGEACHFMDLMVHLAGSPIRTVAAAMMARGVAVRQDKMSIVMSFEDGSVGTVNYFANGAKSYPKELLEVFSQGRVLRLENFRKLVGFGFKGLGRFKTWRQDKGHAAELAAFVDRVAAGGGALIPLAELVNVTLASFAAMTSAGQNRTVVLAQEYAGVPVVRQA